MGHTYFRINKINKVLKVSSIRYAYYIKGGH